MISETRKNAEIKRDIINISQKELQQAYEKRESDLYFTYDVRDKQVKKELSYNFYIYTKEDEERNALNHAMLPGILAQVDSILSSFIKCNPKYIKRVKMAIQLNPNIAQLLLEKLIKIMENYDKKQIAPVIYYAMKEDFNIQSKN